MCNTRISYTVQADGSADVTVPAALVDDFKVLIARGTSTWQNQDDQIRDFADRVLGRDKYVGKNMKNNYEKAINEAKYEMRTCCATRTNEPHMSQCPDKDKVLFRNNNSALLKGCPEECFWATGCSDSVMCKRLGKCNAVSQFKAGVNLSHKTR